jgi:hypothetical protein
VNGLLFLTGLTFWVGTIILQDALGRALISASVGVRSVRYGSKPSRFLSWLYRSILFSFYQDVFS